MERSVHLGSFSGEVADKSDGLSVFLKLQQLGHLIKSREVDSNVFFVLVGWYGGSGDKMRC